MSFTLQADLAKAQAALERFAQEYLSDQKSRFNYGDWFDAYYFDFCEFVGRKGKRIRPLLLLLSYRAFNGSRSLDDPALLRCALALELLHSFVLIHDDVIDRSETRRGLPTFHKLTARRLGVAEEGGRPGENIAMVMGDMIFALSIRTLQEADFPPGVKERVLGIFLGCATDTGAGEIYDIALGARDIARVTPEEIEQMYHLKTTRYTFESPCVMGALLAEASPDKVQALREWSSSLGLAFQIENDLLEFKRLRPEDPQNSADLLEGKKTLLLREAYERLNDVEQSFLQMCLATPGRRESAVLKIRELILKSGAPEILERRCALLLSRAEEQAGAGVFEPAESTALRFALEIVRGQVRQTA